MPGSMPTPQVNPAILQALMQRAGMGSGAAPSVPPPVMQPAPQTSLNNIQSGGAIAPPGVTGGATQPPGALPAPAPAPSPQVPLPNGPGSVTPPAPVFGGQGSPSFNPSMTGAEPTAQPGQPSPPNAQFGRNPLGALLLPQTIQQFQQRFGANNSSKPSGAFGF